MPVNMFKFGFSQDEPSNSNSEEKPKKEWLKSEEIVIRNNVVTPELLEKDCPGICSVGLDNMFEIKHVSTYIVADMIRKKKNVDDSIFKAEQNHSDLNSAVYEGGLKIWQCTYDLLEYIYDNKISLDGKKVLDLGCGTGIIGIYAFINGAQVYFQDYNPEVIRYVTIPNVLLNAKDTDHAKTCKYYSGDWKSFADLVNEDFLDDNNKFDYIFTSETIYNVDNYDKLLLIFQKLLKKKGIVYLAAKTYYFGVGGGTRQFEDDMDIAKCYEYETCWSNLDGVQREILKISFK